ncbi:EVE domain-containing protein [Thermogemmatispora sp.]|uniref:EVE domain-containing protein n=1 Tax=Thermogemmatispora sp. TaxID=1968838 RepID=UPI001DF35FB9|nr:EVE domain-containing protein [Thermogemmatispora sp.]MBX5450779.1 EVE domain-containing protein [Thermogemmatispora sp.]
MAYFLVKTEPSDYGVEDLERERRTVWDGVRNPQAVRFIAQMRPRDWLLIYHSGTQAALVGLGRVVSWPRPDPADPRSQIVDIEFVRRLARPVTLREIKESQLFSDWSLVRQPRLSVMPVPERFVHWLRKEGLLDPAEEEGLRG